MCPKSATFLFEHEKEIIKYFQLFFFPIFILQQKKSQQFFAWPVCMSEAIMLLTFWGFLGFFLGGVTFAGILFLSYR